LSGRKIGVFGGTFDPIHLGHLIVAEEAAERLGLEKVFFVPAKDPWRKPRKDVADAVDRLKMVRLAVEGNPRFSVSTVDMEREGPSYSVDTLEDLRRSEGASADFHFILGYDALADLPNWREPGRLADIAHLVAVVRPGYRVDWSALERVVANAQERIALLEIPEVGISSTELRRRVAEGRSIRYWVPESVDAYIRSQGLYRAPEQPVRRSRVAHP